LAAAKGAERVGGRPAAADGENLVAEALTALRIEYAVLLEKAVRVRGQHLGPLVAVIPRGVASTEDVAEAVREAVVRRREKHGDLLAHLFEQLQDIAAARGIEVGVHAHVEEPELDLAQHGETALEVLRRE